MRVLVFALFTVLLSGCNMLNNAYVSPTQQYKAEDGSVVSEQQQKDLEAALLQDFPTIPVPVGYRVDLTESTSFYAKSYSAGKISLKGSSTSGKLFNFFAEEMEANGWTLVNKMQSSTSVLNFAKPGKLVSIHVFLDGSVTILVTPE